MVDVMMTLYSVYTTQYTLFIRWIQLNVRYRFGNINAPSIHSFMFLVFHISIQSINDLFLFCLWYCYHFRSNDN